MDILLASESQIPLAASIMEESARWLIDRGTPLWRLDEVTPQALRERLLATGGELYLVWQGEAAIATLIFQWEDPSFWPEMRTGEAAYVHRLAVRRFLKGQNTSRAMIEWAKSKATQAGRRFFRLDCASHQTRLREHYHSLGFSLHSEIDAGPFHVARFELRLPRGET